MRKKYILFLLLVLIPFACTDNFKDMNTDKKNPSDVKGEYLFTNAQKELVDQISSTNVNLNIWKLIVQYWTETTYIDEANYDIINRNIPEQIFTAYYRFVLKRMDEAKVLITEAPITSVETEAVKANKLAIIELHKIYAFHNLVNIFGDVPYEAALDIENISPIYDGASAIYANLLTRIDAAYASLDDKSGSFGSADLIYGGDVAMWKKFANSLKLKIAINLADVPGSGAQAAVEAAVNAGVFTSNNDDALLGYQGSTPNTNPLHEDLVLSGRKDFVPANTIIDMMVGLNDPRLNQYFQDQIDGEWVGGKYGYSNAYPNCSHIHDDIQAATFNGILMTNSEVQFYLAEAAARTYSVGGTADEFYANAIMASFDFWGSTGVEDYMAQADVVYDAANWKEKIGTQAYIALYTRGLVAYNTFRRLDFPAMNVAQEPATGGPVPTRFTYPVNEQTLNADSYYAASTAIGGDDLLTKLFWDIN